MKTIISKYEDTIIFGSTVWTKEWMDGNDVIMEIHFPVRNGQLAIDLYHKHFWYGNYSEEEKIYGPGRPITVELKIKRNKHRTYTLTQKLRFGEV